MLNFAEQTGSGAVMLVWSFPTRLTAIRIYKSTLMYKSTIMYYYFKMCVQFRQYALFFIVRARINHYIKLGLRLFTA